MPAGAIAGRRSCSAATPTWDCEAAKCAGVPTIGVLTGGFSERELIDAGAVRVFEQLGDLLRGLADMPLG